MTTPTPSRESADVQAEPLKPCPFCGDTSKQPPLPNGGPGGWAICCDLCEARTRWHPTREAAYYAWNRRPGEAAAIERCADAVVRFRDGWRHSESTLLALDEALAAIRALAKEA